VCLLEVRLIQKAALSLKKLLFTKLIIAFLEG
jgi:hypothetical protein